MKIKNIAKVYTWVIKESHFPHVVDRINYHGFFLSILLQNDINYINEEVNLHESSFRSHDPALMRAQDVEEKNETL